MGFGDDKRSIPHQRQLQFNRSSADIHAFGDVPNVSRNTSKALQKDGVRFERYPGMDQDESGIWTSPSGAKVAWFKDPDGNTLSISEH